MDRPSAQPPPSRSPRAFGTATRRHWLGTAALIAVLGLGVLATKVMALDPANSIYQYNIRTWRRADGIPSNSINAIVQVPDRHIWLGTAKGLAEFDGIEFRAVGLPGIDDSRSRAVTSIARRSAGGLWVRIDRGGYGYFADGRYSQLDAPFLGSESSTTRVVLEGQDGSLFLGTLDAGGRRLNPGIEERLSQQIDVSCLHADTQGRIWMGTTSHGLFFWQNGRFTKMEGAAGALWRGNLINAVTVDHAGRIWVGASNGLHCLNPDLSPCEPNGYNGQPKVLLVDSHGVLWIGNVSDGLTRWNDGAFTSIGHRDGLASNRVLSLAESDDGSLWVGTEDGLSVLTDVKFPIISTAEGLSGEACLSVAAAPDGGIWAGTSNGLSRLGAGPLRAYGFNKADGFPSEWIKRLFVARDGDVYLLGGRQDFDRFHDGRVVKTWETGTWPQAITEDAQGVMVAANTKLLRVENDELVPYRLADGSEPVFSWINELLVARDGSLWVGSKPGLAQIREGKLHNWLAGRQEPDESFFYFCEDDGGAMWAARNSGLVRIKDGKFSTVDHRQGLHTDLIFAIVPDLLGNFWLDSPEGVFRVSQAELNAAADGTLSRLNCTVFDGSHTVRTSEKTTRDFSGCRSIDGRIWFPTAKGVLRIDPAHLPQYSRPPATTLQRVLVDGRAYPTDREPSLLPGAGNLEFDYGAIDYQAPERIRYRYRLIGYQSDWVEAGPRRSAFYTNLNPGSYRFEVQACSVDGVWNELATGFALTLPRRFYEGHWFKVAAGLAVIGFVVLVLAVRERRRRRAFAEIRQREELQMQMIASTPVSMALLDRERRVLHTNATFTLIFGYTAAEVPDLETWWRRVCPPSVDRQQWTATWGARLGATAPAGRAIEPVETTIAAKDGTLRHLLITTATVGDRLLVVCSDLTDHKRAEDERRQLEEQLRQGQKMEAIGRLSGGVAHDFNNLLTVILGNVMLMEMSEPIPPDLGESVREIRDAAQRAANLTRQLLAFSRKQPIHPAPIDLNHIVREMTRMLQRLLPENIHLDLRLAPVAVPVRADTTMAEQVLLNLVVNARDAMPRGGQLVLDTAITEIAPGAVPPIPNARAGHFVCLGVSDTGTGIPPEVLPRIFEPFFTTKDVGKGTGLGLATVYGIVEQHNGWISVSSELGRGTTFRIHLPLHREQVPATVDHAGAAPSPQQIPSRIILLVEDDPSVRALARRTLSSHGHRVLEAAAGPLALPLWEAHRDEIEVLLTDVVMPGGMSGIELARRLIDDKPGLRVVYSSGYSAEVSGGDFSGREGIDFIAKPYDPAELLRIIERVATAAPPH